MTEIDPKYKGRIARMRNLKLYSSSTDEEIYQAILRKERAEELGIVPIKNEPTSDQRFKDLFKKLQSEYGIDMNESNDVEALKMLAKHIIQREAIDAQINQMTSGTLSNEDTRTLKNLGDFQRSVVTSISELQDRLGISRKLRKEKQMDDVPAFIENLKNRAASYWERQTIQVRCDSCKIELARYWLNFPTLNSTITMELECQRCKQTIMYVK